MTHQVDVNHDKFTDSIEDEPQVAVPPSGGSDGRKTTWGKTNRALPPAAGAHTVTMAATVAASASQHEIGPTPSAVALKQQQKHLQPVTTAQKKQSSRSSKPPLQQAVGSSTKLEGKTSGAQAPRQSASSSKTRLAKRHTMSSRKPTEAAQNRIDFRGAIPDSGEEEEDDRDQLDDDAHTSDTLGGDPKRGTSVQKSEEHDAVHLQDLVPPTREPRVQMMKKRAAAGVLSPAAAVEEEVSVSQVRKFFLDFLPRTRNRAYRKIDFHFEQLPSACCNIFCAHCDCCR